MLKDAKDFNDRDKSVNVEYMVASFLAGGLATYLFYALLAPEKF